MTKLSLDGVDRKLLGLLQAGFPLTAEPYSALGLDAGIPQSEVMRRIEQMKSKGLVRQISPVLDARRLGYKTTLVAMRVKEAQLDQAVTLLIEHPGISHAYERDHHFNLWLTLAVPETADIDSELRRLADMAGAEAAFALPAVKVFKLRTYFGSEDDQTKIPTGTLNNVTMQSDRFSPTDRKVINELQQDLPLTDRPFAGMSARLGMDEEEFIKLCRSLLSRGIIRRYGASVNHRGVGFAANAMTCWAAPEEMVEVIAGKLVPLKQVSHCYERKTNPQWHHNLFAMIHGHTKEQCREIADKISAGAGLTDYVLLFSTREFKKTRVIYQV